MKKLLAILIALLGSVAVWAQQSIRVEVHNIVELSERFNLVFVIEGEHSPSDFQWNAGDDVNVVWGPQKGTSTSVQMINGKTTRSSQTSFTYILQAKKTGTLTIQPAVTKVKGDEIRSKSVTIQVDPDQLTEEGEGVFVLSSNALGAHIGELFGSEVRLESFISPAYAFRFPQENHKTVPVIPVSYLTFRPQFMLRDRLRLQPDSVIVYGEPAYLENVERIYTHKISASNLHASKVGNVALECPRGVRLSVWVRHVGDQEVQKGVL